MMFTAMVNGAPANLIASPLTGLTATIAGPTTDYASYWQAKMYRFGRRRNAVARRRGSGLHSYTFPATAAIPAGATGSYSVGLEGYIQPTSADPRYAAVNPVLTFAVTDPTPQATPDRSLAQRTATAATTISSAHGGARKDPQYCVFGHNPADYDSAGAPRFEGTSDVDAEALDFRHMLHKVHAGTQLSEPYVIGGFPLPSATLPGGTPNNFAADRYPAPLTACDACHTSKNWTLPPRGVACLRPDDLRRDELRPGRGQQRDRVLREPVLDRHVDVAGASHDIGMHELPRRAVHARARAAQYNGRRHRSVRDVSRLRHGRGRRAVPRHAVKVWLAMAIALASCSDHACRRARAMAATAARPCTRPGSWICRARTFMSRS